MKWVIILTNFDPGYGPDGILSSVPVSCSALLWKRLRRSEKSPILWPLPNTESRKESSSLHVVRNWVYTLLLCLYTNIFARETSGE